MLKLYFISKIRFKSLKLKKVMGFNKALTLSFFLSNVLYKYLESCVVHYNYIYLYLNNKYNSLYFVSLFLRNSLFLSCNQLLDITIVDRLEKIINYKKRFEFIYVFLSTYFNIRIILKGFVGLFESLPSIASLFSSANWLERECWDLFGVIFHNHNNLRRILTDYGFLGHPFRKDFPLTGFFEFRYDNIVRSVVMEPLELSQEFRDFQIQSPWRKL